MSTPGTDSEERPTRGSWLRVLAVVGSLGAIVLLAIGQVALLAAPIAGDAAGAGMERAFRELIVGLGVLLQLTLAGLVVGVLLPEGARRPALWAGALLTVGSWLGGTMLAGGLGLLAGGPLGSPGSELVGVIWVSGFAGFGLVHGAARRVGVSLGAMLVLGPMAVLVPAVVFALG